MSNIKTVISEALVLLGYESPNPDVTPIAPNRYKVELNGEYLGIWDDQKNTFVD